MSDSGRQIGECRHGVEPEWCRVCLTAEIERLRELAREYASDWRIEALGQGRSESSIDAECARRKRDIEGAP